MANVIYPKCKELMWQAGINASSDPVKVDLVDLGTYTYSATHQYYSSLSGVVSTSGAVGSKTFTNGTLDHADNATNMWTAVTGATVEALVWWQDTAGAATTDPLLVFIDTSVPQFPFTPNSGDVGLTLNASGVAAL